MYPGSLVIATLDSATTIAIARRDVEQAVGARTDGADPTKLSP